MRNRTTPSPFICVIWFTIRHFPRTVPQLKVLQSNRERRKKRPSHDNFLNERKKRQRIIRYAFIQLIFWATSNLKLCGPNEQTHIGSKRQSIRLQCATTTGIGVQKEERNRNKCSVRISSADSFDNVHFISLAHAVSTIQLGTIN